MQGRLPPWIRSPSGPPKPGCSPNAPPNGSPARPSARWRRSATSTPDRWKVSGLDDGGHELPAGRAIRGVGKIVKSSSTEFVKRARRGPLTGRPDNAVFDCPFEVPRFALETIDRWKQPMVPEFKGGPRFVKIGFTDASWARVKTDEDGLIALVGPNA